MPYRHLEDYTGLATLDIEGRRVPVTVSYKSREELVKVHTAGGTLEDDRAEPLRSSAP